MGNNEASFQNRLAKKAPIQLNALQTQGNKIMKIADILRPFIADMLKNARTADGMPVQPATVRAVALNSAQYLLKTHV